MALQNNYRNNGAQFKKNASTAFAVGNFVTINSSGYAIPGGSGKIVGICNETITSASKNYATNDFINVSGGLQNVEFVIPVATGTATQTLVGELVDIDASNLSAVDVTASTNDQILVTGVINATTITGKIVPQTA